MKYKPKKQKIMKKTLILLTLICVTQIFAQSTFHLRSGATISEYGKKVIQTADKNYLVFGQTDSYGGMGNPLIIKYNQNGNIIWTKDYYGGNMDYITDGLELPDKSLIVCGYTWSYGSGEWDGFLMKTDSLGNFIWAKAYGTIWSNGFEKVVYNSFDNGFYITGWDINNPFAERYQLIKTDSNGNVLWEKAFGIFSDYDDGDNLALFPLENGDVIFVAQDNQTQPESFSCWKISSSGNQIWSKKYEVASSINWFGGMSVARNSSSELFICSGYYSSNTVANAVDNALIKLDSAGNFSWFKSWGLTYEDQPKDLTLTHDGGIVMCGKTLNGGFGDNDAYLIKVQQSNGSIQWAKAYGTINKEIANSVFQSKDRGLIFTGGSSDSASLYLVKTDSLGNTSCNYSSWNPIVNNHTLIAKPAIAMTSQTMVVTSFTWSGANHNFYNYNYCTSTFVDELGYNKYSIDLYPNPNNGTFKLQIDDEIKNGSFVLINNLGQKVYEQEVINGENFITPKISKSEFYVYMVYKNKKLIKQGKLIIE